MQKNYFFHFGLLASAGKNLACARKNDGFARVWGGAAAP